MVYIETKIEKINIINQNRKRIRHKTDLLFQRYLSFFHNKIKTKIIIVINPTHWKFVKFRLTMSILNDNRNSNVVENNNAINPSRLLAMKVLNFSMINKKNSIKNYFIHIFLTSVSRYVIIYKLYVSFHDTFLLWIYQVLGQEIIFFHKQVNDQWLS